MKEQKWEWANPATIEEVRESVRDFEEIMREEPNDRDALVLARLRERLAEMEEEENEKSSH